MKKNLKIREGRQDQLKPTSTPWIFFSSFTIFSLWKFRMIRCYFFLCPVSISTLTNKKKTARNSRGKTRPMETHFYTMGILFSFTRFSLRKFRTIPCYFCFCHVSISRIMNAKKTRNLRGNHCECKTLFCSLESVYVVTDCCTFQFSAHFSTVIWSCLCVWSAHNKTFPRQFDCTYVNRWKCVFRTISDRHTITVKSHFFAMTLSSRKAKIAKLWFAKIRSPWRNGTAKNPSGEDIGLAKSKNSGKHQKKR